MEIYKLMGAVLSDIGAVEKNQKNASQGYTFRGVDDVYNAVHMAVKKHGIFCLPEIKKIIFREKIKSARGQEGWHQILEISYKFCAPDGSFVECTVWGESADYGSDKTTNKCMSIAHKYALFQVFMIPVLDMEDPDKSSPLHDDMVYRENQQRRPNNQHQRQNQQQQRPNNQQQQQRPNNQQQQQQRPNNQQQQQQRPKEGEKQQQQKPAISESEASRVEKMKTEMVNLVATTEADWPALTGKSKQEIITIISSEKTEERLKARWKTLQKLLFDLPEAQEENKNPASQTEKQDQKG